MEDSQLVYKILACTTDESTNIYFVTISYMFQKPMSWLNLIIALLPLSIQAEAIEKHLSVELSRLFSFWKNMHIKYRAN